MNIYLRELSLKDGIKELEYLRQQPYNENGFYNPAESEDLVDEETFNQWINKKILETKNQKRI